MEENKEKEVADFEAKMREDLAGFLQKKGVVDGMVPVCPDVEEKWGVIARAYLPDGAREFAQYPVVSLGWMMLVGIAVAFYWDTDWVRYGSRNDIYESLRDMRGYDNMDEAVVEDVLGLKGDAAERLTSLAAETASRVYNILRHEPVEPGTQAALGCYIAALHQLYLAGMAVELNALGYRMTPLSYN